MTATFTCRFCFKFFFNATEAEEHERAHTVNKKLTCPICKIGFARRSYLSEHMYTHKGEQPHSCYYCLKSFSLRCNLVRHLRIHTGEKPFSCAICKQSFTLKKNMTEHQRVHTGERPFQCPHCNSSFSRRSSLVRHARTHTGEKSYQCHECQKQFSWKYYLRRHVSTHLKKRMKPVSKKQLTKSLCADVINLHHGFSPKPEPIHLPVDIVDIKIEESDKPCMPCTVLLRDTQIEDGDPDNIIKSEPLDEVPLEPEVEHHRLMCPPSYVVLPPCPVSSQTLNLEVVPFKNEKSKVLPSVQMSPAPPPVLEANEETLKFTMSRSEFNNFRAKKLMVLLRPVSPDEKVTQH